MNVYFSKLALLFIPGMNVITDQSQLEPIIRTLPDKPGIYQFIDKEGTVIYVGKAKNLRKRVLSYFNRDTALSGKVRFMVKRISDIRHIVVETELDALLLENNLIKTYQPRYNIQLKDDKSFPWICIKIEPFPRVYATRNPVNDGSEYYGPYASVKMMNTLLDLIRQLYPLRNCNLHLTPENIRKQKFRVCLQYHIGNCLGPCEGHQSEQDYLANIQLVRNIIKGNLNTVKNQLIDLMTRHASAMEFEKAHLIKGKIELLEKYKSKSTVVNPAITNVDVFSICGDEHNSYVNFLKVVDGAIIQSHTIEVNKKLQESDEEILTYIIHDLRQRRLCDATELIVPFEPGAKIPGVHFTIPQRGDKKHLLELSHRNATYYEHEKKRQRELADPERYTSQVLQKILADLNLKALPAHIECFDNSNIQGTNPVAAMVVFTNAKPNRKEYRHFNIRTVAGPDDFSSMAEIVTRRYKRLLEEQRPLPQLIVIDGGKGQLNAAYQSLAALGLHDKIEIIGIAKRLEEIYKPGDPLPLFLDKKSTTLKIIQQLRDEAHRFAITHHRRRRLKTTLITELTQVKGIGKVMSEKLLKHFGSVQNIRNSALNEIEAVVGKSAAKRLFDYLHGEFASNE